MCLRPTFSRRARVTLTSCSTAGWICHYFPCLTPSEVWEIIKQVFSEGMTVLSQRRGPPQVLTSPTFPRFLGKEAMVTLRREDGYPREKCAVREILTSSAMPRAITQATPEDLTWKNRLSEISFHPYFMTPNLWFIIQLTKSEVSCLGFHLSVSSLHCTHSLLSHNVRVCPEKHGRHFHIYDDLLFLYVFMDEKLYCNLAKCICFVSLCYLRFHA